MALLLLLAALTLRIEGFFNPSSSTMTCSIPFNAHNRWLDIGVDGYLSQGYQLDGLPTDPRTISLIIPALDCAKAPSLTAFCELFTDQPRDRFIATNTYPCL